MEVSALAMVAVAWVSVLARIAFDFFRTMPRPAGRLLQGCGYLLVTTGLLADVSVEVGGWPQGWQRITHIVVLPLLLAGPAIVVGSLVRRGRRRSPVPRSPGA
jgi:hypothetical protein